MAAASEDMDGAEEALSKTQHSSDSSVGPSVPGRVQELRRGGWLARARALIDVLPALVRAAGGEAAAGGTAAELAAGSAAQLPSAGSSEAAAKAGDSLPGAVPRLVRDSLASVAAVAGQPWTRLRERRLGQRT
jgi:hypothetical protein